MAKSVKSKEKITICINIHKTPNKYRTFFQKIEKMPNFYSKRY